MGQEQPPKAEMDMELVEGFAHTFISRFDMYPLQLKTGRYVCVKKTLDLAYISLHLQGAYTIGAYALDQQSQAKWLCLDADTDAQWQALIAAAATLEQAGVQPYLESSRRGGHLWLFTPPLPGAEVRRIGRYLVAEYELGNIEVYPKQDQLHTGPGSFVRLPLGKHRKSGRRYHFIQPTGEPLAPTIREQIHLLAAPVRAPDWFMARAWENVPVARPVSPTRPFKAPGGQVKGETPSERIKNAISVKEFVSHYVELDQLDRGYCPFHDDEHKSFGVSEDGNYWHCWAGCGGGSIIDFWMKWRETQGQDGSFSKTVKELATMLLPRPDGS